MAVSLSPINDSLVPPPSSIHSRTTIEMQCFYSRPNFFIFTTFNIMVVVLLLPLCIVILHHGLQQLRSSSAAMSHSDCFTYHMAIVELIGVLVSLLYLYTTVKANLNIFIVGSYLKSLNWHGQTSFHLLTCVERYLAVVHPITYRSLRSQRGLRFRNISVGAVWLLCFVAMSLSVIVHVLIMIDLCLMMLTIAIVSFCSYSVLRVLNHPGPQEQGRERVDQFKRRAFNSIVAILAVLLARFAWGLAWAVLDVSENSFSCMMMVCGSWINLPSSLVLPLLFLYREGRVACFRNNTQVE